MKNEFGTIDGCGDSIVMGNQYGYSTDSNGITTSVIGKAVKFTSSGRITLIPMYELRAYGMSIPKVTESSAKSVSVKPMKLFPVHSMSWKLAQLTKK